MAGFGSQGFGGGLSDSTPPTITGFVPAGLSTILKNDHIAFNVPDEVAGLAPLGGVTVYATFDGGTAEIVYAVGAFAAGYSGSATTVIAHGLAFDVVRDATWPTAGLMLTVVAIDAAGNDTSFTVSYTVSNPTFSIDADPPIVNNFSPSNSSPLAKGQAISFDVTDNSGAFRRIIVIAAYPTGEVEVVYDGSNFRGFYAVKSSRSLITRGFHFSVLRSNGWPSAPTITVYAIDQKGNEGS